MFQAWSEEEVDLLTASPGGTSPKSPAVKQCRQPYHQPGTEGQRICAEDCNRSLAATQLEFRFGNGGLVEIASRF
jgi:hypothetical protein